jgi:nucleotide-binding universal stress UspA family protein
MTKSFKKILVPFDNSVNSKRALSNAIALAELSNGTLSLVHVISYHNAMAKIVQPYKGKMISHVKKFMKDAKHSAFKKGILVNQHILYGNPSEKILDMMKKEQFDVVIMGRRGTTKITGPSMGSVSSALVQTSKIPVLVVN